MSQGLPPQLLAGLTQPLPYEPDRLFAHIPAATMTGPSIEYLVHTGNTNPDAAVAELGTKPDLGMQLSAKIAYPVKIAALASFSVEAWHDFETFLTFVPAEMQRAFSTRRVCSPALARRRP